MECCLQTITVSNVDINSVLREVNFSQISEHHYEVTSTAKPKVWAGANKRHVSGDDAKKIFQKEQFLKLLIKPEQASAFFRNS